MVSPIYLIWLASIASYALLAYLLFRLCMGKISIAMILSPMLLLAPVIGDYLIRKDALAVSLYGLCLLTI
jgi:hypothetical protein